MKTGTVLWLIPFYLFLWSCSNENNLLQVNIGTNFIQSQTNAVIIDSFTVNMSTVMVDSVTTSKTGQFFTGKYSDKYLGEISATGFFQINIPEVLVLNNGSVFDSITLVLNYEGVSYGDTLSRQEVNVFRVTQDMENEDNLYYNTTSCAYEQTPVGNLSFYPKPNFHDSIEIKLNNTLGLELFNHIKEGDDEISTSQNFIDYFKGLAIVPGKNNSCILSFIGSDSLVNLKLYTHYVAKDRVEVCYNFPMYSTSTCFSHIEADRSGTPIENIATQREEISSHKTNDMTFVQGGLGLFTRLDFPGLGRMLEMDYKNILYKAELILKPYQNAYLPRNLPTELVLYNTDRYNNLVSEITSDEGESIYADFFLDEMYNEDTYYRFDITNTISDALSSGYINVENGLIVSLPEEKIHNSLEHLSFDARDKLSIKPVLKLYYIFYQ